MSLQVRTVVESAEEAWVSVWASVVADSMVVCIVVSSSVS